MFKTLLKFLLPALGGSGIVCLTMHLTNTSGNLFNSLQLLNIKEKPDVDEEEIRPQIEEPPTEQKSNEDSGGEDEQKESTQETTEASSSDSSDSSASSSVSTATGTLTPEEAIKLYAERMTQDG